MKQPYIRISTFVASLAIITLQTIWLIHTFILLKNDLTEKSNSLLIEAIDRELFSRINNFVLPENGYLPAPHISSTGEKDYGNAAIQEAMAEYGSLISLITLDSIYNYLLYENQIQNKSVIFLLSDGAIKHQYPQLPDYIKGGIKTGEIPIRMDKMLSIKAEIINPYSTIFKRMALLIVATIIMMFFIGYCIAYQIKIIIKQNKIAEIRQDFSNAMIHDMKSPISTIMMGVQAMSSPKIAEKPTKKEEIYRITMEECNHLLTLANKVLSIARLEEGNLPLSKNEIPVTPLFQHLTETFRTKSKKQIEFVIEQEVDYIYGDNDYIKEAISNLIDNAIKYSGDSVKIEIRAYKKDNFSYISVKDNGNGIPVKDQSVIFEKFERASATRKGKGPTGFGLGLNYVQRVIQAHGGNITIQSIENEFSEFTISLPLLTEEI